MRSTHSSIKKILTVNSQNNSMAAYVLLDGKESSEDEDADPAIINNNQDAEHKANTDTIIEENNSDIATTVEAPSIFYRRTRNLYRTLTILSLIVEPLYCYFLFTAIRSLSDEEFEIDNEFWDTFITVIAAITAVTTYFSDIFQVNPMEEAEVMVSRKDEQLANNLKRIDNSCELTSTKFQIYFTQAIANGVYLINSTEDAISIAYLTSIEGLRWGIGIPVTLLGFVY
jgi:hypothetical protein